MKAYWIGKSVIAAPDVANALLVMARHEPAEKWAEDDVRELTADEMSQPVDEGGELTIGQAAKAAEAQPSSSRLEAVVRGRGALIRWDYPAT